ncbi:unnamed protein product [Caenorhabditis bovis]|uniref:Uncharacterized protein n=1 Tax=Caenorhabditis bovis TaxID=2654633 RepID=A0A8S1FCK9_9PELO|nr:unnamed protein product [Caenorhabditis bovis]
MQDQNCFSWTSNRHNVVPDDGLCWGKENIILPKTHNFDGAGKVCGEMMCPFHKTFPVKGVVFIKHSFYGRQSYISYCDVCLKYPFMYDLRVPFYSDFHKAVKILYPFDTVKARQDTILDVVWTFWKKKAHNYLAEDVAPEFDWDEAKKKVDEDRKNLKPKEKMEYHPNALLRKFYFDRMCYSLCGKSFCAWHDEPIECAITTLDRTYDSWVLVPFCEDCVRKEKNKRPDYTEDLLYAVEIAMKKDNYLHIGYYCKWPPAYKEIYGKVVKKAE